MNYIITVAIRDLITWTHSPEAETFAARLAALTDDDLLFALMYLKTEPAGRIAWAEYGRRTGFIDFEIRTVVMDGKLNVVFEGDAKSTHHGAILELKS